VDEAFIDAIPGEAHSLAATSRPAASRILVIRSLTKTWGLAGLRIGYVLGDPALLDRLRRVQPLWSVSSPALAAAIACSEPHAVAEAEDLALRAETDRRYLEQQLAALPGVRLPAAVGDRPRAPFVLVHARGADRIRLHLRDAGFALRRGDTFPGLGQDWLRIAVREPAVTDALIAAWPR
jgi:histidinol-phosphate aminotransferase